MADSSNCGDARAMNPETFTLRDGGWIRYWADFFGQAEADRLFEALQRQVAWEQLRSRFGPFPRLTAFAAEPGIAYRYSGVVHEGRGWTATLLEIKRRVEVTAGAEFNGVLLNRYRDGRDSMGRHADAEPELGRNPLVASVSFGAIRLFVLRHKGTRETLRLNPTHGSLLIMGGTIQHHWQHELPKTQEPVGERINLTFRRFVPHAPDAR